MGGDTILKNTVMICAPLMAQSVEQIVSDMYQAKAEGADVAEIRLDFLNNFQPLKDLEIILKNKPLPVLIVYRPKWAGGQYEGDEHKRLKALNLADELGADYVDFELKENRNQVIAMVQKLLYHVIVIGKLLQTKISAILLHACKLLERISSD